MLPTQESRGMEQGNRLLDAESIRRWAWAQGRWGSGGARQRLLPNVLSTLRFRCDESTPPQWAIHPVSTRPHHSPPRRGCLDSKEHMDGPRRLPAMTGLESIPVDRRPIPHQSANHQVGHGEPYPSSEKNLLEICSVKNRPAGRAVHQESNEHADPQTRARCRARISLRRPRGR